MQLPEQIIPAMEGWHRRIAEARTAAGFRRQEDLADAIGMSQSSVTEWERGKKLPSLEAFLKIADATKRPPEWVMFGICANGSASPPPAGARQLDREHLARVLTLVLPRVRREEITADELAYQIVVLYDLTIRKPREETAGIIDQHFKMAGY